MTLKAMHRKLADEYLKEPNGTRAAIAAGYSEKTAGVIAHEILQRDDVKAYLAKRTGKLLAINEATVERITSELAAIGFSDVGALFIDGDDGPRLRPLSEWPPEIRVCIASIKTTRREIGEDAGAELVTEIKLWSKIEALKLLAVYRKMVGGDSLDGDGPRQTFVGLAVTVAPGAQVQINVGKEGAK